MKDSYYERFKRWFNMEGYNNNVGPYQSAEMTYEPTNYVLFELNAEIINLRKENAQLRESDSRRKHWLDNAKEQAGYHTNTSFDVVWKETLELANKWKAQKDADAKWAEEQERVQGAK